MHDAIPSRILNGWLRLEEDLFHLQVLSSLPPQIGICCSIFIFKLYHKTCEQFYRHFGLYEKSPNSSLPGLPRSIINQFRFHNFLCLCLASVHLPHPFHLVFGFQFLGHAVSLRQLRHDQLHAVSCRFVNLSAILSYDHPVMPMGRLRLSKKPPGFSDKRLAVCCAHNLCAIGAQIPHLQPEKYFLSRIYRERKYFPFFASCGRQTLRGFFDTLKRPTGHAGGAFPYREIQSLLTFRRSRR